MNISVSRNSFKLEAVNPEHSLNRTIDRNINIYVYHIQNWILGMFFCLQFTEFLVY